MRRLTFPFLGLLLALAIARPTVAAEAPDPFAEIIRTTDPLPPGQERLTFHLPPGFEAQLVAAEPQINKPMNMAFDAQGRLWVTMSREYPFPVTNRTGRDSIMVLSDFAPDGHARKLQRFAEGLNIPIAVLPYRDGCLAWSIPNIWFFHDANKDGVSDQREMIFGPLGWEKDTHGNISSFRRGFDGWVYGAHGFNNTSTFRAKDGSTITVQSGNTYRFRPDGSHIDQYTWGQVNPFGLMIDPRGNLYSADCHSSPIYQLLRGGYYPSFGKPNDGLGFAPVTIQHSHGSTAIAGIIYLSDPTWPAEFQDNIFIGNVMTSRINRDRIDFHGSSSHGTEMPDFLSTTDPWFRPVDIQFGPDGALYIADFYNRIIGHYEVPLSHPGRDHERARIWRIVYRGSNTNALPSTALAKDVPGLVKELGSSNTARRLLALNALSDKGGRAVISAAKQVLRNRSSSPEQRLGAVWILQRASALEEATIQKLAADDSALVRTHLFNALGALNKWTPREQALVVSALQDSDAFVRRAAATDLGLHPAVDNVRPLLALRLSVDPADTHLLHAARIALKENLAAPGGLDYAAHTVWTEPEARALADVAVAVPLPEAGSFLLTHVQRYTEPKETLSAYLRHAARHAPPDHLAQLAEISKQQFADDPDFQFTLFQSVREGLAQRGTPLTAPLQRWGSELTESLFASASRGSSGWRTAPVEGLPASAVPWFLQQRKSADGDTNGWFLCSLPPGGERLTGILRSPAFAAPAYFSFYLAGHDGFPNTPAGGKNLVRLHDAETLAVLAETAAPRNDTARRIDWDLSKSAGRRVFLEIIDGDNGKSYAWLAAGRFDSALLPLPTENPSLAAKRLSGAVELVRFLQLKERIPTVAALLNDEGADPELRALTARTLLNLSPDEQVPAVLHWAQQSGTPAILREATALALLELGRAPLNAELIDVMRTGAQRFQVKLAQAFAANAPGAVMLIDAVAAGKLSPQLLVNRTVQERLAALAKPELLARVAVLAKGVSAPDEERQKVIDQRRAQFVRAAASVETGKQVFLQNCAVCHQINGAGGLVGPQLDGVGNRGADRLVEDILDPSRNVDRAFYVTTLVTTDGEVVSGLLRREEGATLVLADSTGHEVTVIKAQVKQRRESSTSLMPDNFSDVIPVNDFNALLSYLLSTGSGAKAK